MNRFINGLMTVVKFIDNAPIWTINRLYANKFSYLIMLGVISTISATPPVIVHHQEPIGNQIFLDGLINKESTTTFLKELNNIKTTDVTIVINSPGGEVLKGDEIIQAIDASKLNITCKVPYFAASMAANILLDCPNTVVAPKAVIVFHLPYLGVVQGIPIREPEYSYTYNDFLSQEFCFDKFLTKDQQTKFLTGNDVIMTGLQFNSQKGNLCEHR